MNDEANMTGQKFLVLATFDGAQKADDIIDALDEYHAKGSFHDEVVVIGVDDNGKAAVHGGGKAKKGIVSGSIVGILIGGLVGFPVVGVVLGGVLGAHRSKQKAKQQVAEGVEPDVLQSILEALQPDSSLIVTEVDDWQAQNIADTLQSYGATQVLLGPADKIAEKIEGA